MLHSQEAPSKGKVVDIDSFGGTCLIVATEEGEITLSLETAPVLRTKNEAKVTSVVSITPAITLVFSEKSSGRRSAAAYETPELQQIAGLTLHEVYGGIPLDKTKQIAAVFTPAAIRILKFDLSANPKAKVMKTIELKGISACCVSAEPCSALLVATRTEYQLVHWKNDVISPLFPILNGLSPLMTPMDSDYLVVQGTGAEDPAMGLFVDTNGEVARQGVVIQWPRYPTSIAASADHILSICDGQLHVHHLDAASASIRDVPPAELLQSEPLEITSVRKLSFPVKTVSQDLLDRLGDESISEVDAEVALLVRDSTIKTWAPPPRLIRLEQSIVANEIETIEPDPRFTGSEQGIAELKYLSIFLTLHLLREGRTKDSLREWRNGAQLDLDLVLYLFAREDKEPEGVFPGLKWLVEAVRVKAQQGQLSTEFLKSYLKTSAKRLRRSQSTAYTTCKTVEVLLAKLIVSQDSNAEDHELTRLLSEKDLKARKEIVDWLYETRRYHELEHYFNLSGKTDALLSLWKTIIRDTGVSDDEAHRAAENLRSTILHELQAGHAPDRADIWGTSLELISNDRLDYNLGISLLSSPQFENLFDPADILRVLKEKTNSGEPWRDFLQRVVHSKGMFKDDLVAVLINDLIKHYPEGKAAIQDSYERFARLKWPKPKYQSWLSLQKTSNDPAVPSSSSESQYPSKLLGLQRELWSLMNNQLDWMQLMSILDSELADLKLERALVYYNLGLHAQCLSLLTEITDFRNLMEYPCKIEDAQTRRDLAQLALRSILETRMAAYETQTEDILREFLNSNIDNLEIELVLSSIPDLFPLCVVTDFLVAKIKDIYSAESHGRLMYAVAKASSQHEQQI